MPQLADRYEIVRELGRGGMGRVHLARQLSLGREVALKQIGGPVNGGQAAARFLREARLAGSLSHPNIVTVFEYFEIGAVAYIAMEYVPGGSLRTYWAGLDLVQFAGVMEGVLAGLTHANSVGVIHRDLKPENVMATLEGQVKIGDFGLAKATQAAAAESPLTQSGAIIGTPRYMAPEQILGGDVGIWSDLYSLGVMAYENLVGWLPFEEAKGPAAVLMRHLDEGIPFALEIRSDLDPGLARWLARLLAADPAARLRDPRQAWEELEEIVIRLHGSRWRRSSRLKIVLAETTGERPSGVQAGSAQTISSAYAKVPFPRAAVRSAHEVDIGGTPREYDVSSREDDRPLPDGEVTLVFSEVEGSKRLLHDIGGAYEEMLARHRMLLRRVWTTHEGHEVGAAGDSFFVAFTYAAQAVDAVSEAQRELRAAGDELGRVKIRIGVHTGAPQTRGRTYWGADVHYASRLCAAAHGGQVLLSAATRALVPDVDVENLGEYALRDFPGARQIFHLPVAGEPSSTFPPIRGLRSGQTNLPDQIASFIGRQKELESLRELAAKSRLITLVGSGGVGKTRLMLQLGSELLDGSGDGVWLVDLSPVRDSELVGSAVMAALKIPSPTDDDFVETLSRWIGDREMLLLFDNCEQVIEVVAQLIAGAQTRCRRLSIMATSREPLHLMGEQLYRVPPLSVPSEGTSELDQVQAAEAAQLFVQRARQQRKDFVLNAENAAVIARLCRRLDGVPLALELAAVRLRSLSLADLESRLENKFTLLKSGMRGTVPRQQSLSAVIDWSYELLTAPQQLLLAQLSVFAASGFGLAAAQTVCELETEADEGLDTLDALVDKSLLQAEDSHGVLRYRLLESVREYAARKLAIEFHVNAESTRERHRDYFVAVAEDALPRLVSAEGHAMAEMLETEHDNMRLALTYCLDDDNARPGLCLAARLWRFWFRRGHSAEGARALAAQLGRPEAQTPTRERAFALIAHGRLLDVLGKPDEALALCEEAREIGRTESDDQITVEATVGIAGALLGQGRHEEAAAACDDGLAYAEKFEDSRPRLPFLLIQGANLVNLGGDPRAKFTQALSLARRAGDRHFQAVLLGNLGDYALVSGQVDAARARLKEAQTIFRELRDVKSCAWIDHNLACACYMDGEHDLARDLLRDSILTMERIGDPQMVAHDLLGLALVSIDPHTGAALHGAASAMLQAAGQACDRLEAQLRDADQDRLRGLLGEAVFCQDFRAGGQLTRAEAITLARGQHLPVSSESR